MKNDNKDFFLSALEKSMDEWLRFQSFKSGKIFNRSLLPTYSSRLLLTINPDSFFAYPAMWLRKFIDKGINVFLVFPFLCSSCGFSL